MKITEVDVKDVRFPTSLEGDGSDAMNEPDYSCAYVTVATDQGLKGYGLTFTIGRGNEIVCAAVRAYKSLVVGRYVSEIFANFGGFWRVLSQETQLRWLGPEKGVTHMAVAAVVNALWDLWGRLENKPVWKLLADMEPEELVSIIDFTYIEDALTKEEAIEILKKGKLKQEDAEKSLLQTGFPAYTTSVGWMAYDNDKIKRLCKESLDKGFRRFKVKVGVDLEDDKRRLGIVRKEIGADTMLMVDANQRWSVNQAIDWMKSLSEFNLTWIEEPTSPDDILGHAHISKSLAPYGIGVATGEHCQNRVMFKQFLQAKALQYCQIDGGRLGGPNEIVAVILMAAKFGVPVCPHAGGIGLCEIVQHMAMWDFVSVSQSMENRVCEYVDHLHEHMVYPVVMKNASYQVPQDAGYSQEIKADTLEKYTYPEGTAWQKMFQDGLYKRPQ